MISERIVATIRFFDLQGLPLTALEVYKYLVIQPQLLKEKLNESYELVSDNDARHAVSLDTVLVSLDDLVKVGRLEQSHGQYYLPGKKFLVAERLRNHVYGIIRERRIKQWGFCLKYIPFVRGVGLAGSQALGQERSGSDIDLILFTDLNFLWTARLFVTGYFQALGIRRHGKKIANRFCLNHHVAGAKKLAQGRNLYTASEYAKLRPLIPSSMLKEFRDQNEWIFTFFPNALRVTSFYSNDFKQSNIQKMLEKLFLNSLGKWFEQTLAKVLMKRIRQGKHIVVEPDELSFHPHSKEVELLQAYFN